MYMFRGYHSLPNAGTENTPQWMKMPNFASLYHSGSRYVPSDGQSGWNAPAATVSSTLFRIRARSPS